ncbi:unnamed protein product [Ceutorhynchus assimilis]|uniref:Uncharacterized protein n=1 Tax=Ceutorhynchus assimilis TaxID=467358 RepID=A0A9N9QCX1_9CUCU|nr:unnamed protein product [Ceutorhynchus assimilis]
MFAWVAVILVSCHLASSDIFPSLLTTNASIAIVIDKEYLAEDYENVKTKIENYLEYAKRDILRHGGVNVQLFAWSAINVKRDFSALLSITSCEDTWRLFRAAASENLLHIAISEQDCERLPQNNAITIPIIDRGQETPQLLLDLRTFEVYKWKNMVIMYDDTISEDLLTRVIKSITKQANGIEATGISLMSLCSNKSLTVNDLRANLKGKLAVIVSLDLIDIIMEYAKDLRLVNTQSEWLYLISDTNNKIKDMQSFKRQLREGDNVAFIYNNTVVDNICVGGIVCHVEETLHGFIKSLDDAIVEEFEMAAQVSEEEWEAIRPTKVERTKYLTDKVKKYLTDYGTCGNCTKWKLETGETWGKEYQNQADSSMASLLQIGSWRPSDGPSMVDVLFPHIAHGFRRKLLPLVSFHNPPWQILKTNATGDVIEYNGIVFDIVKELARNLNFTYSVEIFRNHQANFSYNTNNDSNAFSDMIENSQITTFRVPQGILEMVHNKTVAMGACAFTVTEENKRIINFTDPISIQTYTFLASRPKELSRALLFISPFRGDESFIVPKFFLDLALFIGNHNLNGPHFVLHPQMQSCLRIQRHAKQRRPSDSGMHLPLADSARIIVGAWWLVVLVIGTTYCGNLVAYLTFPKIEVPITTLDDLVAHRETLTWSYAKNTLFESRLQSTTDPTYKTIYNNAKDIRNRRELIAEIKKGKHVYIDWKIKLQYLIKQQFLENEACSFALGMDEFADEKISLIVAPDTPYLQKINEEIKKLHQVGLIQKWLEDYLPKKDKCWKKKRSVEVNNHTVNLDDMQGSFFVLFIGFVMSILVMAVENLWFKKIKNKKNKRVVQPFIA